MRTLGALSLAFFTVTLSAQAFDHLFVTAVGGRSMQNWHGQASLQALNVEFARALSPHYDLSFVVAPTLIHQPRSWFGDQYGDGEEDVRAISGSLLLRRNWRESSPRASYYAELSTGPMWAERRVPAATSRFNFHSQAGLGVVLNPQGRASIVLGYRFGHISNGGYAPRNPGLNLSSLVLGVRTSTRRPR